MWVCVAQGFPSLPFVVDEDLTRDDGVIVCKKLDALETAKLGWRVIRALRILLNFPWPV